MLRTPFKKIEKEQGRKSGKGSKYNKYNKYSWKEKHNHGGEVISYLVEIVKNKKWNANERGMLS
ncbi:hypothetical protein GCM10020331_008270 [Ectobacillus funiculus]